MMFSSTPNLAAVRKEARQKLGEPWLSVGRLGAFRLDRELLRELPSGHRLEGTRWTAIARSTAGDDVLYASRDGKLALVHLTWKKETRPEWPATYLYGSIDEILRSNRQEQDFIKALLDDEPHDDIPERSPARCEHCGADWSTGQTNADCRCCDGHALTRPCLVCGGRCKAVWTRSIQDSNDTGEAHWVGACARQGPAG